MNLSTRIGAAAAAGAAVAVAAIGLSAAPAFAQSAHETGGGAVFVQTDNTAGNQVVAYRQAGNGTLAEAGAYPTGGVGGVLAGSVVDHLASQGSLSYDPRAGLLFAVNAGSDTVSVFAVYGDRLILRQVTGSGGEFPVSVAVHGDLVYVLNALGGGSLQGYRIAGPGLAPLPGSHRSLGLDPDASPQFTNTPGQVAFTPDGGQLIVTTKANGDDIDVFGVGRGGWLSRPTVNSEPGTVPFAITFAAGHVVIAEAGPNALASFALAPDGTLTQVSANGTGQTATCWVAPAGPYLYASNAGSASESGFTDSLSLTGTTKTDAGTVDASATPDGRFLYVQAGGAGIVDEFAVGAGGALTEVGSVTVPGAAGGEGIVAW